jgi:hypothetical protein
MPNNEGISQNSDSSLFKDQEAEVVPFNTDLLIAAYGSQFEERKFNDDDSIYYTENLSKNNETRGTRYVASKSENGQYLYSLESSAIWEQYFTEEDFKRMEDAGNEIKLQMQDREKRYYPNKKTVILKNAQAVRLELVPYANNSERIIRDMENVHIPNQPIV